MTLGISEVMAQVAVDLTGSGMAKSRGCCDMDNMEGDTDPVCFKILNLVPSDSKYKIREWSLGTPHQKIENFIILNGMISCCHVSLNLLSCTRDDLSGGSRPCIGAGIYGVNSPLSSKPSSRFWV